MKFQMGDIVTRPSDVYDHGYDNRRVARIKGDINPRRVGAELLLGTVVTRIRDDECWEEEKQEEQTHVQENYGVSWWNWIDFEGTWIPGHYQKGFLPHGLELVTPRTQSYADIIYIAKNLHYFMEEKQRSNNEFVHQQIPFLRDQINTLGWMVKTPTCVNYFNSVKQGGSRDVIGQRLPDGNKPATL